MSRKFEAEFIELKALGSGAFSTVFEAKSMKDGKSYAIKKIPFNEEDKDKTLNEINILSALKSAFVVMIIDWWIEDNYYSGSFDNKNSQNISSTNLLYSPNKSLLLHIQMELCSMTLKNFIEQMKTNRNSITKEDYTNICELFVQLLECVQYLHQQTPPIIHRDLKPENVMLITKENCYKVKLTDFGLSTCHESIDQSHTENIGTKSYMAPEVQSKRLYDTKADIYSLGRIMEYLFSFDFESEINEIDYGIHSSYENAKKVCLECLLHIAKERPDCQQILDGKHLWSFNEPEQNIEKLNNRLLDILHVKWPFFTKINDNFLGNCKKISIIDEVEEKVIFTTTDGNIYAIRVSNHIDNTKQKPIIINELLDKNIKSIICGFCHVLCLTKDKHVYSFGENGSGQLGIGTNTGINKPKIIEMLNDKYIIDIKCGAYHSLALSENGKVFAWGSGRFGQIGNGGDTSKNTPIEINSFNNEKVISISCGYSHCLALTESGTLYGWGNNVNGQLGIGNYHKQNTPVIIEFKEHIWIKKICCGRNHSFVLTYDYKIYSFGHNLYGQLGFENNNNHNKPTQIQTTIKFIDISTTYYENLSFGLSSEKIFYVWGECYEDPIYTPKPTNFNSFYETLSYYSLNYKVVQTIKTNEFVSKSSFKNKLKEWNIFRNLNRQMMATMNSFCFVRVKECKAILLTNDDVVYSFRLIPSIDSSSDEPVIVKELSNKKIKSITCGNDHVLCLTENNEVIAFGDNLNGLLGDGTVINNYIPMDIMELSEEKIIEISCGAYHCLALTISGKLLVWGSGYYGQIGNGIKSIQLTPIKIEIYIKIVSISCGAYHCFALSPADSQYLFGWGHNRYGQLGLGNRINRYKPNLIRIPNHVIIKKMICGKYHSLILTNDHYIYSFGRNNYGQLGIGNGEDQTKMIKIETLVKFVDIDATFCDNISAGLSQTGKYYIWGKCGDNVYTTPKETDFTSFDEIITLYSSRRFIAKQLNLCK